MGALELKGIKPPEKLKDLPKVMAKEFPELKDKHEAIFEKIAKAMVVAKKGKAEMVPEREIYEIKEDTKRFIFALGNRLKELKEAGVLKIPDKLKPKMPAKGHDTSSKADSSKDDDVVLQRVRDKLATESSEEKKSMDDSGQ